MGLILVYIRAEVLPVPHVCTLPLISSSPHPLIPSFTPGSLGKDSEEMMAMLGHLMPAIPREKPNHLLGIADEPSVRGAVALGVDTFDSCLPTR